MDSERWNKMTVSEQILNIGGEVQRAVARKENGDLEMALLYVKKAQEWLQLSKDDPKNIHRIQELNDAEEELLDYFGENTFHNTTASVMGYWDSFLSAIY